MKKIHSGWFSSYWIIHSIHVDLIMLKCPSSSSNSLSNLFIWWQKIGGWNRQTIRNSEYFINPNTSLLLPSVKLYRDKIQKVSTHALRWCRSLLGKGTDSIHGPRHVMVSIYAHCTCTSMLTHQVAVGVVAVLLRHGQVHSQCHTVGKDGQKDYDFKRSEGGGDL